MVRYLGPKCRLCRREGVKLFLKGDRCNSPACPIEKKGAVPPGQHGAKVISRRSSEYKRQLREKQKVKRIYGVSERQLRKYFTEARREKAATGKTLLRLLESRLDNVVFLLGLAPSRLTARQWVKHGHFKVNNQAVNIPSFLAKKDDVINLTEKAAKMTEIKNLLGKKGEKLPSWLERKAGAGKVLNLPKDEELPPDIEDQLIVEFYSHS